MKQAEEPRNALCRHPRLIIEISRVSYSGMGDVGTLVKRLSLPQSVAAKAAEYARLATTRIGPGGLGQVIPQAADGGKGRVLPSRRHQPGAAGHQTISQRMSALLLGLKFPSPLPATHAV